MGTLAIRIYSKLVNRSGKVTFKLYLYLTFLF
jgi:hypothetical protein